MTSARRVPLVLLAVAAVLAVAAPSAARADDRDFEVVVSGLDFAVNLAPLPDGRVLIAEKASGEILVVEDDALAPTSLTTLPVDASYNETGLLGLAADPSFAQEPWIYAYFSDARDGMNRLVRMRLEGDRLGGPETLYEAIATTPIHNGGDLAFGRDGTLFLVTGDGAEADRAQDPSDPHGKVLRFERDGTIPADNPDAASPVYALGIRNSFGLCVDPDGGALWETENGPESWDEVNRIAPGANHGWPEHLGPSGEPGFVDPVLGFEQVIVPTGCVATGGAVTFGDFGGRLHRLSTQGAAADEVVTTFEGAVTDVALGHDGALYVLTTTTLFRALDADAPPEPSASASPTPPPSTSTPAASPSTPAAGGRADDAGFGAALRTTAGLVVIAVLGGAFLWLRGRALRR